MIFKIEYRVTKHRDRDLYRVEWRFPEHPNPKWEPSTLQHKTLEECVKDKQQREAEHAAQLESWGVVEEVIA